MVCTEGTTATVPTVVFHICACCFDHVDVQLVSEVVTCPECGGLCSCEGCVADVELRA